MLESWQCHLILRVPTVGILYRKVQHKGLREDLGKYSCCMGTKTFTNSTFVGPVNNVLLAGCGGVPQGPRTFQN